MNLKGRPKKGTWLCMVYDVKSGARGTLIGGGDRCALMLAYGERRQVPWSDLRIAHKDQLQTHKERR